MFAIVLQHCPKDLTQRLNSNPCYSVTNSTKDIIALMRMICDASHAQDDTAQGTMEIVASDVSMYTTYMIKRKSLSIFVARSRRLWTPSTPMVGVLDTTLSW